MYTSVLTTALAASAATLLHLQPVAADAPPSSYGLAFPNGLHQLDTDSGGLNNVPHPSFSSSKWAWGTLPQVCFSAATKNNYCNVYDVEVYDVTYSDCQQPWTVCRCNNANMDPNTLFTNIGFVLGGLARGSLIDTKDAGNCRFRPANTSASSLPILVVRRLSLKTTISLFSATRGPRRPSSSTRLLTTSTSGSALAAVAPRTQVCCPRMESCCVRPLTLKQPRMSGRVS